MFFDIFIMNLTLSVQQVRTSLPQWWPFKRLQPIDHGFYACVPMEELFFFYWLLEHFQLHMRLSIFFLSCYQTSCSTTFPPTPFSTLVFYTSSMQFLQPFVNHTWHLE